MNPVILTMVGETLTLPVGDTIDDPTVRHQVDSRAANTVITVGGTINSNGAFFDASAIHITYTPSGAGSAFGTAGSSAITVNSGAILRGRYGILVEGGFFASESATASIINEGQILATLTRSGEYAIGTGNRNSALISLIDNRATGFIDGISGYVSNITNSGIIDGGAANAIVLFGSGTITNNVGGIIRENIGTASSFNSNTIEATSTGAVATINNSGTISAPNAGTTTHAIFGQTLVITNTGSGQISGTTNATNAIAATNRLELTNTGTINGNILGADNAVTSDVVLANGGSINGTIRLGAGDDQFTSAASAIVGVVYGGAGNDMLMGGDQDNQFFGDDGADNLNGSAGNDVIEGGAGDDILNGGLGIDTVSYAGSSFGVTVHLDNPTAQNTVQHGIDTLIGFENILGSAQADSLFGDEANNVITGGAGFDTIVSGGGTNTLIGGADGDTYFVQGVNDIVTEAIGGGYDVVLSQVNFTLAAGSEVEALAVNTTAGIMLTGNDLQQNLTGNVGNDTLNAGGGNDLLISGGGTNTLIGGTGSDIYFAQGVNDVVTELAGGGFDVVLAGGNLSLASNSEVEVIAVNTATGVTIIGSDITQTIQGGSGDDRFVGGLGNDTLTGSAGADVFVLRNTFADRDFITDFVSGADKIEISASLFGGGLSAGGLSAAQFLSGAGATAATTADQRFIYNSSTGNLYFDADGNGAGASAIIANLSNIGSLTASDFVITAAAEEPSAPKGSVSGNVMDVSKAFASETLYGNEGLAMTDQLLGRGNYASMEVYI